METVHYNATVIKQLLISSFKMVCLWEVEVREAVPMWGGHAQMPPFSPW